MASYVQMAASAKAYAESLLSGERIMEKKHRLRVTPDPRERERIIRDLGAHRVYVSSEVKSLGLDGVKRLRAIQHVILHGKSI